MSNLKELIDESKVKDKKAFTVYLTDDTFDILNQLTERFEVSRSKIIEALLKESRNHLLSE